MLKPRHQKLLEELPKNGYKVYPSAVKAGYKETTALKQPKRIMCSLVKAQAKEILNTVDNKSLKETKQAMYEIVGISRESLLNNVKYLAEQDKDLSTRYKIVASLVKELGVILGETEQAKTIVPILNIGITEAPQSTPLQDNAIDIDSSTIEGNA